MELMPHIKVLLDDLIKMTKTIIVKRSDIATEYETDVETVALYNQYKAILEGEDSYYLYKSFPQSVLNNICKWDRVQATNLFSNINPRNEVIKMSNGINTMIVSDRRPTDEDIGAPGDGWVYRVSDNFAEIARKTVILSNYKISVTNIMGDPLKGLITTIQNGEEIRLPLKLYVYDNLRNKYIEVLYKFVNEYIPVSEYNHLIESDPFGNRYSYTVDGSNNMIKYVFDDLSNAYIETNQSTGDLYYNRIYSEIYYKDTDYYIYTDYFTEGLNPSYYEKIDNTPYYMTENGLYTTDYIEGSDVYYKYNNTKAGIINFNETMQNGQTRFNKILSYSYNGESYNTCVINHNVSHDTVNYYYNFAQDNNGIYIYENGDYIIPDEYPTGVTRYRMNLYLDPITLYSKNVRPDGSFTYDENQNGNYIYISSDAEYYLSNRCLTPTEISNISNDVGTVPDQYRDKVVIAMRQYVKNKYCPNAGSKDFAVDVYTGETNSYYRELNGLPPLSTLTIQPKIDRRLVNPDYDGPNKNPFIYELTDIEIERLENDGTLAELIAKYPAKGYLRFLGKNRIDVLKARDAAPYEILRMGYPSNGMSLNIFNENYKIARNYILNRHYHYNMYKNNDHYGSYIGFMILVQTMCQCMAKSGDILLRSQNLDEATVRLILNSYGFEGVFDDIPLIYRREIARNIALLIRNKGIDDVYDIIYKIFNVDNVEIFKYYFRKIWEKDINNNLEYETDPETGEYIYNENGERIPKYDLFMSQVPIHTDNFINDINNKNNKLGYDDITGSDPYWGAGYESDESLKRYILEYGFNYINSKYISLNTKCDLTELNFAASYLLNYLLENSFTSELKYIIDGANGEHSLFNLITALFAIQAIRLGYDGNIPNDVIAAAAVFKFNLNKEVTGKNGEMVPIIEKYKDYMSNSFNGERIRYLTDKAKEEGAIIYPTDIHSIDGLAKGYLENLNTDNPTTYDDEDSFYNELLYLKRNSKNINDYNAYSDLLDTISVCKATNENYKLHTPIWEEMFNSVYTVRNGLVNNPDCWRYHDMTNIWVDISSDYDQLAVFINTIENNSFNTDITLVSNRIPDLENSRGYTYAVNLNDISRAKLLTLDLTNPETYRLIKVYKLMPIFNVEEFVEGRLATYIHRHLSTNTDVFTYNLPIREFNTLFNNMTGLTNRFPYYLYVNLEDVNREIYRVILYKRTDIAFTYAMYLREYDKNLYNELMKGGNENDREYHTRVNNLYSTIIATIENSIVDINIKNKARLSYSSFDNIFKYIKKLINIFKSYTVDLVNIDSIYDIDDIDRERAKIIDNLYSDDRIFIDTGMNITSNMSSEEHYVISSILKIKDELDVVIYGK